MESEQIAKPPTEAERAQNHLELRKMHRGNRFRLMFGLPLLPENKPEESKEPKENK